jgi:pentapeptide repeat protein
MAERTRVPADDAGTQTRPWYRRPRMLAVVGLVAILLVALVVACALWIPTALYPSMPASDLGGLSAAEKVQAKADRLKLQNDARTTFFQGLAALVVLGGAGITASMTLRQVRATREGQVTDRYTKAIDQLDKDKALAVRLGGLYALERIARDSPADRATIAEVLCAYVRTAPRADPPRADPLSPGRWRRMLRRWRPKVVPSETLLAAEPPSLEYRAPDVQAALAILGRWQERLGDPPPVLDLHQADIQGADLPRARLQGANLWGTQLQRAFLRRADLQGAWLLDAELQGVDLGGAKLQGARLYDARLHGAILRGAELQGANFRGAELEDADLTYAKLHDADLRGAGLQGADLTGADLQGATLAGALANKGTTWPKGWDDLPHLARVVGIRFEAEREADVGSTCDAAQRGEEPDASGP